MIGTCTEIGCLHTTAGMLVSAGSKLPQAKQGKESALQVDCYTNGLGGKTLVHGC